MKTPIPTSRPVPCGLVLVAMALALSAAPALANRDLGGTFYWVPRPDIAPNTVEFHITHVHRLNHTSFLPQAPVNVGDVYADDFKTNSFEFGDCPRGVGLNGCVLPGGNTNFRVLQINHAENWVVSEVIDDRTNDYPRHQYANANPRFSRQAERNLPPYDQLNANRNWETSSIVWPDGMDGNGATGNPQITLFDINGGIIKLPQGGIQQFQITTDQGPPSGFVRGYRMGNCPTLECGSGFFRQPRVLPNPAMSIDPITGIVSWNTSNVPIGTMWSFHIVIDEENTGTGEFTWSMVVGEVMITGGDPGLLSVTVEGSCDDKVTVQNPFTITAQTINDNAAGTRNSPGNYVSLSQNNPLVLSPPVRRSLDSPPGGCPGNNPSCIIDDVLTTTFNRGPKPVPRGTHNVTFTAVDALGFTASCNKTITVENATPDCDSMTASIPNPNFNDGTFVPVTITPAEEDDNDPVTYQILEIFQDEHTGANCPDAIVDESGSSDQAYIRRERDSAGNGRTYYLTVEATDNFGAACTTVVEVCVFNGGSCAGEGSLYDSDPPFPGCPLGPGDRPNPVGLDRQAPGRQLPTKVDINRVGPMTDGLTLEYALPAESDVQLGVYDLAGRNLGTLVSGRREAGVHRAVWNVRDLPKGIYYYRLRAGDITLSRSVYIP